MHSLFLWLSIALGVIRDAKWCIPRIVLNFRTIMKINIDINNSASSSSTRNQQTMLTICSLFYWSVVLCARLLLFVLFSRALILKQMTAFANSWLFFSISGFTQWSWYDILQWIISLRCRAHICSVFDFRSAQAFAMDSVNDIEYAVKIPYMTAVCLPFNLFEIL